MAIGRGVHGKFPAAATTAATSSPVTTTNGSCFVIGVVDAGTVSSVTDSKGNTYTRCTTDLTVGGVTMGMWHSTTYVGGAGHTFTVNFGGSADPSCFYAEITGSNIQLDQVARNVDAASPFTVTSGTTTAANEVLVSFYACDGGLGSPAESSGFDQIDFEDNNSLYWTGAMGSRVVSSTGAYTPSWTSTVPATTNGVFVASFKENGGGTSITPSVGALVLTGLAASVALSGGASHTRTPSVGALTLSGLQPVQTLTVAAPITGALTLSGNAATVLRGTVRQPSVGALTLTGQQPTVVLPRTLTPSVGSLTLTGLQASVTVGVANTTLIPTVGSMTFNGQPVTVIQSSPVVRPSTGVLTLTGNPPGGVVNTSGGYIYRPFSFNWWKHE
jgi:hypothetical protein